MYNVVELYLQGSFKRIDGSARGAKRKETGKNTAITIVIRLRVIKLSCLFLNCSLNFS